MNVHMCMLKKQILNNTISAPHSSNINTSVMLYQKPLHYRSRKL